MSLDSRDHELLDLLVSRLEQPLGRIALALEEIAKAQKPTSPRFYPAAAHGNQCRYHDSVAAVGYCPTHDRMLCAPCLATHALDCGG